MNVSKKPEIDYKAKYLRSLKLKAARRKKYVKTAKGIKTIKKAGYRQHVRKNKKKAIDFIIRGDETRKELRLNRVEQLYDKLINHINTTGEKPQSYSFLHLINY